MKKYILLLILIVPTSYLFAQPPSVDSLPDYKNWTYNKKKNKLKVPKLQSSKGEGVEIQLFPNDACPENEQVLAEMLGDSVFTVERPLKVNGAKFNGVLYGYVFNLNTAFMCHFKEGILDGNFVVNRPNGMIVTKVFNQGKAERIFYDNVPSLEPKEPERIDSVIIKEPIREDIIDEPVLYKPIIYLYPEETTTVHVTLDIPMEQLLYTYPKYPEQKGWEVNAAPSGELKDKEGKAYYGLYWEAIIPQEVTKGEGFVVEGHKTRAFLEEKLDILGLNARERNEFIIYWLPKLEKNSYNWVYFSIEDYTKSVPLKVSPKPDTEIRFLMLYTPMDEPMNVQPQALKMMKRKGFTLVEWGGMLYEPRPE